MKSCESRDWLQIVSQFSVVGSLIFVGIQLKQDREIAIAASPQPFALNCSGSEPLREYGAPGIAWLDGLKLTGNLRLIRDPALQNSIAAYYLTFVNVSIPNGQENGVEPQFSC